MAAMEGESVPERLEGAFKPALIKGWIVWPWVQLINFKFVPLDYRVMAVNVVALGMSLIHLLLFCRYFVFPEKIESMGRFSI